MNIVGCVYMIVYHNDHRDDWRIIDQVVATTKAAAQDFAEARKPEGYHVDNIFEDSNGPTILVEDQ